MSTQGPVQRPDYRKLYRSPRWEPTDQKLVEFAREAGMSVSEAAWQIIKDWLDQHQSTS